MQQIVSENRPENQTVALRQVYLWKFTFQILKIVSTLFAQIEKLMKLAMNTLPEGLVNFVLGQDSYYLNF